MKPRRLHSETIFSINSLAFGPAIRRAVFLNGRLMSREARERDASKDRRKIFALSQSGRYLACGSTRKRRPKQRPLQPQRGSHMSWYYAEAGESRGPVTDAE